MAAPLNNEPSTEKLSPAELASRVLQEQRQGWEDGKLVLVESLLLTHPTLTGDTEAILDLIYNEVVLREKRGEQPALEEYQRRFPELADDIKDQFDVHKAVGSETEGDTYQTVVRPAAPATPQVGVQAVNVLDEFPGFEILDVLGRGGMGVVYKARQLRLKRLVAVKMIRPGQGDAQDLARFRGEAEAVARLQHPNIVQVFEVGEHREQMFLVLEYVAGGSLAQRLRGQPQSARDAAQFVEILARAVQHAHDRGIVHRDLKPANILLAGGAYTTGNEPTEKNLANASKPAVFEPPLSVHQPKITDFGLAKQMEASLTSLKTETGAILGTPSYMAPEQAEGRGDDIGPLTDVYSLGAILYEMLTGRPPFRASSVLETVRQVSQEDVVSLRRLQPNLPRDIETICLRCLEKDARRRYESAVALADDLHRFLAGEPIVARPVSMWERSWKFAYRRPALAGLIAVAIVAALSLLVLGASLWYNAEQRAAMTLSLQAAEERLTELDKKAVERRQEIERLDKVTRHTRYASDMHLADQAWSTMNFPLLIDVLDRYGPSKPDTGLRGFEWHYRKHLSRGSKETFTGQTRAVYHPKEPWIATLETPNVIKLINFKTKAKDVFLRGHEKDVTGFAFMPSGDLLVSASKDETVRFWTVPDGKLLKELKQPSPVHSFAVSRTGNMFATGGNDGIVRIWNGPTFDKAILFEGHEKGVTIDAIAFSPTKPQLASTAVEGIKSLPITRTCDVRTGDEILSLGGHANKVTGIAFSPDGRMVATSSLDETVYLWDAGNGLRIQLLRGHRGGVNGVAFDPFGFHLATASSDKTVRLWKIDKKSATAWRAFGGHTQEVTAITFSPDGQQLLSAGNDRTVRLWDMRAQPEGYRFTRDKSHFLAVAFHPQERLIAAASYNKNVTLYDLATGRERKTLTGHTAPVNAVVFSNDGKLLASAAGLVPGEKDDKNDKEKFYGEIHLWDGHSGEPIRQFARMPSPVLSVLFSPDGKFTYATALDGSITVWDLSGERQRSWDAHKKVAAVTLSQDGTRLASAGADGVIKIWDSATGKELFTLSTKPGAVECLCFHPKDNVLAAGGRDKNITLWDLDKKTPIRTMTGHERTMNQVAFSPDGRRLISASADWTAKVWDADFGLDLLTLRHELDNDVSANQVSAIALSGDGKILVSIARNMVFVWGAEKPE